jgi:hypothetical protein
MAMMTTPEVGLRLLRKDSWEHQSGGDLTQRPGDWVNPIGGCMVFMGRNLQLIRHQRKTWFSSGLNRGKARHVRHGDKQSAVRLTCESLNHMLQDLGIDPSQGNLWSGRPVDYQLHFINVSMRELTI